MSFGAGGPGVGVGVGVDGGAADRMPSFSRSQAKRTGVTTRMWRRLLIEPPMTGVASGFITSAPGRSLHMIGSRLATMVATVITWYLGEVGAAGTASIVAMLVIAFVKGRLVILDFMELREAPRMWRILLEGWLILVSGLILLAYWMSLR